MVDDQMQRHIVGISQEDIAITESDGKGPFEPPPSPPDGWLVTAESIMS